MYFPVSDYILYFQSQVICHSAILKSIHQLTQDYAIMRCNVGFGVGVQCWSVLDICI